MKAKENPNLASAKDFPLFTAIKNNNIEQV